MIWLQASSSLLLLAVAVSGTPDQSHHALISHGHPGVSIAVHSPHHAVHAPAPAPYAPPAPAYHAPAPVYHEPAPVYHKPAPTFLSLKLKPSRGVYLTLNQYTIKNKKLVFLLYDFDVIIIKCIP